MNTAIPTHSSVPVNQSMVVAPVAREWFETLPAVPSWRQFPGRALLSTGRGVLGAISGIALLAIMATVPVLNVLALGYLIGMAGRVAQTGLLKESLFLAPAATRIAGILLLGALPILPLRYLIEMSRDAMLLAPWSFMTCVWTSLTVAMFLLVTSHIILAIGRGGAWRWFFRPLSNLHWTRERIREGNYAVQADAVLRTVFAALRPWYHFRLGLLGFTGIYVWLLIPALVFDQASDLGGRARIASLMAGGATLVLLLGWMPFLLTHFAAENRWQAWIEFKTVRQRFRHSPFCCALSALLLYASSMLVMLYEALMKNNLPTHEARWDVMVVFMVTMIPFKVFVGWAWHRAGHKPEPWRMWQWLNRILLAFGLGWYVYFLFLARTGGQLGQKALWQFHSLLLPFP